MITTNLLEDAHKNYKSTLRAIETDLRHNITKESLTKLTPAKIRQEINKTIGGRTIEQRLRLGARNLFKDTTAALRKDILDSIKEHQDKGHSIEKMTKTIKTKLDTDTYKARRIARTESHRMREFSTYEAQIEAQKYEMFKREWLATADMRTRQEHLVLGGQFEGEDGRFHYGEYAASYPGGFGVAKMDIHCFPGETLVYSDSPIDAMYKQLYDGQFVAIKTSNGVEVTGTFNHAVYTSRGWVALGELKKSDKVGIVRGVSRFKPKNVNVVSTFKQVYDLAISVFPIVKRRPGVGMDFHGYIPEHEVNIVFTNGLLGNGLKLFKGFKNWKLVRSLFMKGGFSYFSVLMSFFTRKLMSPTGFISRLSKCFGILSTHAQKHGLRSTTLSNPGFRKPSNDYITRTTESFSSSVDGIRDIIEFDNILSLDISVKKCHVYNLQSVNNYYFVNSIPYKDIGLLVHNCRCTIVANFDDVLGNPDFIKHGNNQESWENDIMDRHSRFNKEKLLTETLNPDLYPFDVAMNVSADLEHLMNAGAIGDFDIAMQKSIRKRYMEYLTAEYETMGIELRAGAEDVLYLARQQKLLKALAESYPEGVQKIKVLTYRNEPTADYMGFMQPYRGLLNINTANIDLDVGEAIKSGWSTQGALGFKATDRTLVHEYGHFVDLQENGWASNRMRKPTTMTGYGRTNSQEAFAESFVNAVTAPAPDKEMVKFIEKATKKKVNRFEVNLEVLT